VEKINWLIYFLDGIDDNFCMMCLFKYNQVESKKLLCAKIIASGKKDKIFFKLVVEYLCCGVSANSIIC
jgi:hypothetical protein